MAGIPACPKAFAVKMWNWTKMGPRGSIVHPGEIKSCPASRISPALQRRRVRAPARCRQRGRQADAPHAAQGRPRRAAWAIYGIQACDFCGGASVDLEINVGHDNGYKSVIAEQTAAAPYRTRPGPPMPSGDMAGSPGGRERVDAAPGCPSENAKISKLNHPPPQPIPSDPAKFGVRCNPATPTRRLDDIAR